MKKLGVILLILVSFIIAGCTEKKDIIDSKKMVEASDTEDSAVNINYELVKKGYTEDGISISYPQIANLSDSSKEKKINKLIEESSLSILDDYKVDGDKLTLEINYEIMWKGLDLLSVEYVGYVNTEGAAHPVNVFYTVNIGMDKGNLLKLKDVVNVDEALAEKYKEGTYKAWEAEANPELQAVVEEARDNLTNNDLIEQFNGEQSKFYFTENSLGISIELPHALGDHAEFEIAYDNLADNIKTNNKMWKELIGN